MYRLYKYMNALSREKQKPGWRVSFSLGLAFYALAITDICAFTNQQDAAIVVGQANMTTKVGASTSQKMSFPSHIASDGTRLLVPDAGHNRIMIFNTILTSNYPACDLVIGQPNITSGTLNNGGIGPNT